MRFGSHIYGTDTPESDQDFKVVYIPDAESILLGESRDSQNVSTKPRGQLKNSPEDVDIEIFSVKEYLRLLMEGQTMALDMLFNTKEHLIYTTPHWDKIIHHRGQFIHSGVSAFAGYCKTQASKYGIKGSRIAALTTTTNWLSQFTDPHMRLSSVWDRIKTELVDAQKPGEERFLELVDIKGPKDEMEQHLEVCAKAFAKHVTIKYILDSLLKALDAYGDRARKAARNEGVDWKAMMHAVRVCSEARELLTTGHITFPRPDSELLLKIRKGGPEQGGMASKDVSAIIEQGLEELIPLEASSGLPKKPNQLLARAFNLDMYAASAACELKDRQWDPVEELLTQHGYKALPR
jgi:hypothetical protein